jgi:hypothetical protein
MRLFLMLMLCLPTAVGFLAGYSTRALLVILALSAAGAVVYGLMFAMCKASGEADDQAGYPRG